MEPPNRPDEFMRLDIYAKRVWYILSIGTPSQNRIFRQEQTPMKLSLIRRVLALPAALLLVSLIAAAPARGQAPVDEVEPHVDATIEIAIGLFVLRLALAVEGADDVFDPVEVRVDLTASERFVVVFAFAERLVDAPNVRLVRAGTNRLRHFEQQPPPRGPARPGHVTMHWCLCASF